MSADEKDLLLLSTQFYSERRSLWRRHCLPCVPKRYILAVLSFLGFVNVYAMRVNLSMAIIVMANGTDGRKHSHRTYNWTPTEQGFLLSAFFVGYIITQIPGGWLAQRFSAKYVFGVGILATAIFTLLTPLAASLGIWVLVAVRILEGIFEGVTFPSNHTLWGKWAPPAERSRLITFVFAGQYVGNILSFPLTALLCKYGFAGGWPSAFYLCGIMGVIWFFFWLFLAFDSPSSHPRITSAERRYIENAITEIDNKNIVKVPTPWFDILTSPAVWGTIVVQFSSNYGFYVLLTTMPTYFKQAVGFDIKKDLVMNGVFSAIPYFFDTIVVFVAGAAADLIKDRFLSVTNTRKLFSCSSLVLQALFIVLCAYFGTTKLLALLLLTLTVSVGGMQLAGHSVAMLEMAPRYAGIIMGLCNTAGTLPGIIGPLITKLIAHANDSDTEVLIEEWRNVFIIAAEVFLFGAAIFAILGDARKQSWSNGPRIRGRTPVLLHDSTAQ
ncbi:PREDICTED: sialin-like [Amphimedon queenslandica]|uniref:Sialin n=1 Tax=Amphimedon queenslandica TaxID=400682 RepID=A0A1X7UMM5_AMPQE|nr:PREDICTED: sialin-like [Amphimedon queenslandica]|eukprot:XP_019853503.1 PREDICTED: sialin-like [Amphimedon queenslandica]